MLTGRARELDFLAGFCQQAAVSGGALVLSGDPGVGKTALLNAIADAADAAGTTVLRVAGVEFEADISFAGLNQGLLPLLDDVGALGAAHQEALRVALGFGIGPAPDRLLVSTAALALLRHVAARAPLLLIVDDLPWIDRASAGVLSFVARRLAGARAGLLVACRTGAPSWFDRAGLPDYELKPLADEAAAELVAARFPGLDPGVRNRLLDAAQGNPLALLELPLALSDSQRSAAEPLPPVLPLSQRLQELFAARIASLPSATRALLLAAALERAADLRVLVAAGGHDYQLEDLAPAERERLVRADERRVTFRHPLIRFAAVQDATLAERHRAHRALAAALADRPELRAWHLGEACVEPDEQVASLLEEAARAIARRGDYSGAVARLARAADLSPDAAARDRRLAEAAYVGAQHLGDLSGAAQLLEEARPDGSLHYASAAAFVMLNSDGQVDTAHRLLTGAIEGGSHGYRADHPELVAALSSLALVCFMGGRAELWQPCHAALARLTPEPPPPLALTIDMFADPVRTGVAALPRLEAALRTVHDEVDPDAISNVAGAAMYADRLADVREPLWRVVRRGREDGAGRTHLVALMDLCTDDFHRGEWGEAAELAAEGLSIAEDRGVRFFGWYFRYHQALLAAVQGRFETSRTLAAQIIGWAGPRGVRTAQVFARQPLVLADLGQGDYESAYQHAAAMSPPGVLASHVPHCLWVVMDLVEAAVRTHRQADAERHVRAMRDADIAALSPRLAILAAASAAIAAPDERAPALFERALSLPTVDRWPFDVARVRLAYGERLRRTRAATESRIQLRAALAAFAKLGAAPWAARAELELRATGEVRKSSSAPGAAALTPQELQIAQLAAAGLTNKQIAERLFLSPRTVGGHLYQIFPKLGITTRAALRDALGTTAGPLALRALHGGPQVVDPAIEPALHPGRVRLPQRDGRGAAGREARQDP
jgi:DNA-binding CsgD family transcriptional regulator/tetratricopeptide (TPR) repeat protein